MSDELRQGDSVILGLDIGASSIGWAYIQACDGKPVGLIEGGVRIFPAGVEGDLGTGRDEPRTLERRQARQTRRQLWRRQRRRLTLFRVLQEASLLPATDDRKPDTIHKTIQELDNALRPTFISQEDHRQAQLLPYLIRSKALSKRLDPHALGRALYHLGQRRGFLSNRKEQGDDDERGKVKAGIAELQDAMTAAKAPTLGAYFATLDPNDDRIRQRWTARVMYEHEFNEIMDAQTKHHPELLTEAFRQEIHKVLFHQRPLRSQRHLIGTCELEEGRRRAPAASLLYQRFRILQAVNHLMIEPSEQEQVALEPEQRVTLITALELEGDLTFAKVKKLLGLKRTMKFNLERGGEKKIPGDRVSSMLRPIFGDRWDDMALRDRERIVDEILGFEEEDALFKRAANGWGLDHDAAESLAAIKLEPGYARLSRLALTNLLPSLEDGMAYSSARKEVYPESFKASEPHDRLPVVRDSIENLRNPAVERCLTELRRLVNTIIATHGKPDLVRIELARDLKRGRKDRIKMSRTNRDRQNQRDAVKAMLLEDQDIQQPSRADIEKALLAEECGWICPYTGKPVSWESLFGPHPQFDIEHIIPLSMSLDNSFLNKTLCHHEENRHRKQNRTPWQAYGETSRFQEILDRVSKFNGDAKHAKFRRFKDQSVAEELVDNFSSRQLNDTRYATKLAMDYLGMLYGGQVDDDRKRRVRACAGGVTAFLRRQWGLENLLSDGDFKSRDDHRHHLVDAVVVALSNEKAVRELAHAAQQSYEDQTGRLFAETSPPWPELRNDLQDLLSEVVASHRVDRRLNGGYHEATNYSPPIGDNGKQAVRKPVNAISKDMVDKIADPAVRDAVKSALERAGTDDPKKAFKDGEHVPMLPGRRGLTPIRKVRIHQKKSTLAIGDGIHRRHVAPGSNHHMAIVEVKGEGDTRWESHIVTLLEANLRRNRGEPIIQKEYGEGKTFKFSLRSGDLIRMKDSDDREGLFVVRAISGTTLECVRANDARPLAVIKKAGVAGGRLPLTISKVMQRGGEKVEVTPLGHMKRCNA